MRLSSIANVLVLLSFHPFGTYAQPKDIEYGINAATFVYQGDLTPIKWGAYNTMKYGMGLWAGKRINSLVSGRIHLLVGKLHGDDATYSNPTWMKQRNFNFTADVIELSALAIMDIPGTRNVRLSPYLLAGGAVSSVSIKRDWNNLNAEYFSPGDNAITGLPLDQAHRLPKWIASLPVGAGIRYELTDHFSLHAETAYRFMFTDYLDGFSKAANPDKFDHYQTFMIGLSYHRGSKNKLGCPANPSR